MSRQHFDEQSSKSFTLTLFLSFVALFCVVLLMMLWHGDFKPGQESEVRVNEGSSDRNIEMTHEPSASDSAHYAR